MIVLSHPPPENGGPIKERMEAFQREIEMMELVGRHPNIITILGGTKDSRVIVFEQAMTDLQVCRSVLQLVAVCGIVLQHATFLQYVAVFGSVLQCAVVCCSMLQYSAVCCRMLQNAAECCSILQYAAVCCSMLQYAVVCCSMLQCVAFVLVFCSVLQCVPDQERVTGTHGLDHDAFTCVI